VYGTLEFTATPSTIPRIVVWVMVGSAKKRQVIKVLSGFKEAPRCDFRRRGS